MGEIQEKSDAESQNPSNPNEKNEKRIEELKQVYRLAIETRNFEINNLIQRNNFYMLFQGVLLASALATEASKPYVELIICLCGIAVSWFQIGASAGAKYWQEYWEIKVDDIEKKLSKCFPGGEFIALFQRNDNKFHKRVKLTIKKDESYGCLTKCLVVKKFSVSRQPIYTAVALLITWFFLLLHTFDYSYIKEFPFSVIDGFYFVK